MKENLVQNRSYDYALKIVSAYKFLSLTKKEFILSKQLLRSGTAIGANVEEAIGGQSRKDFSSKLSIAYKEARETSYWIRILLDSDYLEKELADSLLLDCNEILRIIGSIQRTIRNKNS